MNRAQRRAVHRQGGFRAHDFGGHDPEVMAIATRQVMERRKRRKELQDAWDAATPEERERALAFVHELGKGIPDGLLLDEVSHA
jgi:hypothetical protein